MKSEDVRCIRLIFIWKFKFWFKVTMPTQSSRMLWLIFDLNQISLDLALRQCNMISINTIYLQFIKSLFKITKSNGLNANIFTNVRIHICYLFFHHSVIASIYASLVTFHTNIFLHNLSCLLVFFSSMLTTNLIINQSMNYLC